MSKSTPRREQERQQHIKHILDVAESIFAEQGFFQATMRRIAQKAEFALGTIYSRFGSKRQLYEKVIETKVEELVNFVTKETLDAPLVQDKLEKFIHAKMTFFRKNLPFLRLYLADVEVPRPDVHHILPKKVREKYDSMLSDLTGVIWQGIQQGFLKPMDARVAAKALDGLTNTLAFSWLGAEEAPSHIEDDINIVTELFLYGAAVQQEPTQNQGNRKELNNGS